MGLSFIDLLYAVPVADLAVRVSATHLHGVTLAGWLDVAVVLTAITLGWIGHHTNREKLPDPLWEARQESKTPFTELRFVQFVVEVLIIVAYFSLDQRIKLPAGAGVGSSSLLWKAAWLFAIYALYVVWDILDVVIAQKLSGLPGMTEWKSRALKGGSITVIFAALFGLSWIAAANHWINSPILFDGLALAALYLYRVIQQFVCEPSDPKPEASGHTTSVARRP